MKLSLLTAYLVAIGIASANPLFARQAATTSSSTSSDTSSSQTSTSSSSTSTTSASTTSSTSTATDTTSSSTSSSSSSSTSTTSGSAPTSTSGTPSDAVCTQEQADQLFTANNYTGSPALCGLSGNNNTVVIPADGVNKFITWWTGAFTSSDSKVTVHLDLMDGSGSHYWSSSNDSYIGFLQIQITQDFLKGAATSQYQMVLEERHPPSGLFTSTGPVVHFIRENTTPPPPPPTSFNFLGVAIGVPIAVAVIAAVLGVFCCVTNRHRSFFAKIKLPTSRRGYGVRQSRRQRVGQPTDDFDFDASAPIYRDDPGAGYSSSTREERSARAMGVFSAESNLHSTY